MAQKNEQSIPKIISEKKTHNSPRKTRISKEPGQRRQEIIETALALFSEKGYEDTTIQDIVERMNVSPGLCYRYFKSKTEIFAATSEYYAMQAVEQIKIPVSQDLSAVDKLNLFTKQIFEYIMKHQEFEANYHENSEIRASRLDHVAEQMVNTVIPIIEQGVTEEVFHCKDISNTTRFLIFGLLHTFHNKIPTENTGEYILYFRDFMQEVFCTVLKMENTNLLHKGTTLL